MTVKLNWFLRVCIGFSYVLSPLWTFALNKRLKSGKETLLSVQQKTMQVLPPRQDAPVIWGHAVGVGEALALSGLFAQLVQQLPDHQFVITSSAKTSGQALERNGLPPRCSHQFAPIDTVSAVTRFLNYWQPCLAIWCEMDLWPVTMALTQRRNIPMFLVNARLTEEKFNKRRRFQFIYKHLLSCYTLIFAQNTATQSYLHALGAKQVSVAPNIKALAPALSCNQGALHELTRVLLDRHCWVFASSHPGEEQLAIEAQKNILQVYPDALLIIAPRNQTRGGDIKQLCISKGFFDIKLRSNDSTIDNKDSVYIADTIGEMGLWYRVCSVVLMGGSFVPVGGHNPYEPLILGARVLSGPQVFNFQESYDDLQSQGKVQMCQSSHELATHVLTSWAAHVPNLALNAIDEQHAHLINVLKAHVHHI